ncbi:DUF6191 domain-containing protein [Nocardia sp. NPDC050378]|uniref:DUF6191 domain-containing protein n=1 Tax=Nocardia sp. NPDC050378 TaxID=3155400 RepID=UPI0033FCB1DB
MGMVFAMTIPGLAIGLILLTLLEVVVNRLTGSRVLPWTRKRSGPAVAATGFEHLAAMFQGSKHHEFEQRQTTLMHRENPSDGAPPRDEIDLSGGSARLIARER